MLIFLITFNTLFILMIINQSKRLKTLELNYNKLCNIFAGELNGPEIVKQLSVGITDLSLNSDELKFIREKCIKKLKRVDSGYYGNENEKLGNPWDAKFISEFLPNTIIKMKHADYVYLIDSNKKISLILDGKNKILKPILAVNSCERYHVVFDSTEVNKMLEDYRRKKR